MKTIDEIRNDISLDHGFKDYNQLIDCYKRNLFSQYSFDDFFYSVCQKYLNQKIEKASEYVFDAITWSTLSASEAQEMVLLLKE